MKIVKEQIVIVIVNVMMNKQKDQEKDQKDQDKDQKDQKDQDKELLFHYLKQMMLHRL